MRKVIGLCILALSATAVVQAAAAKADKTIKEVMAEAHKGTSALNKKASGGMATKAEAELLASLYKVMGENDPPKGDKAEWKKKCDALVTACQALAKDPKDKAAIKAYSAAVNCAGCHKAHK